MGSEPQLHAVLAQAMPPGILMLALQSPLPLRHSPSVSHTASTSHTLPSSPSGRGSPGKWLCSDPENSPESIETKAPKLAFLHSHESEIQGKWTGSLWLYLKSEVPELAETTMKRQRVSLHTKDLWSSHSACFES